MYIYAIKLEMFILIQSLRDERYMEWENHTFPEGEGHDGMIS